MFHLCWRFRQRLQYFFQYIFSLTRDHIANIDPMSAEHHIGQHNTFPILRDLPCCTTRNGGSRRFLELEPVTNPVGTSAGCSTFKSSSATPATPSKHRIASAILSESAACSGIAQNGDILEKIWRKFGVKLCHAFLFVSRVRERRNVSNVSSGASRLF